MSGEIGIPFLLQLKDGVNAIHLTDFEGISHSVEDAPLYQYLTNGSPFIEQPMCIQPVTQVIDNVELLDNGVHVLGNNLQVLDNNIQIVDDRGNIVDNNIQIIDNSGQVVNKQQKMRNNFSVFDNAVITNSGQIIRNKGHLTDKPSQMTSSNIKILNTNAQILKNVQVIDPKIGNTMEVDKTEKETDPNDAVKIIYEVVYPEQLNLKFKGLKRGRPKKAKVEESEPVKPVKASKPAPKTRSGRVVRIPKHIEKDFKKVELRETITKNGEMEIKTVDFERYDDEPSPKHLENYDKLDMSLQKVAKRKIAAQYRCPKCQKAYLGKTKMIQHIKNFPDHGPLPIPRNENNFDVWNYLVDITQKCPPAQRGAKFCGELTNLLHNVLLLTSALFKEVEANKTFVEVDKVLGNAISLPPGPYKFNESELYKDVTVLKLITNTDFFKPIGVPKEAVGANKTKVKGEEDVTSQPEDMNEVKHTKTEVPDATKANCDIGVKSTDADGDVGMPYFNSTGEKETKEDVAVEFPPISEQPITKSTENIENDAEVANIPVEFDKKPLPTPLDDRISVHQELLSENSLLHLPNLRTPVDDLLLTGVDSGSTLLDNSTSSDEVMNVDQFVNERFKKITEPDLDISSGSLNLDLPPLDLFQFHTS